ncbi:MAG: MFS transporter [Clostridia bacterium]|nr:MFS transporter [Clostridia bacterium]
MESKLSKKFWISLVLFSFIGQVAWVVENMYFNVYIYKIFNANQQDIALMVALSAVSACITTILIGALSDKIGKRKTFICFGYILWGLSIMSYMLIPSLSGNSVRIGVSLVIIMDCIMTFFGSSANDACFNAWLTDSTNNTNRGKAEGINSMMPLLAVLAVFGGFIGFNLNKIEHWNIIFLIIGLISIITGIVGIFIIDESFSLKEENKNYFKNIFYGFRLSTIKQNKNLYIMFLFFAIFNIAIQIFMPYLILYYEKYLLMENYVLVMGPSILISAIATALYGKLYDKFGLKRTIWIPLYLMVIGFCMLAMFIQTPLVFIGSTFMLSGDLMGMGIFGANIRDLTPIEKTGGFQGIRIFSQVLIPGIVGPNLGAFVLRNAKMVTNSDGTQSFIPNPNIFLTALIVMIGLIILLYLYLNLIPKLKQKNQNKIENN